MYFFVKTQNPRPTFHLDMTADERAIMERHVAYWSDKAARGIAIVFGPVLDPQGVYGIGVYQVQNEVDHSIRIRPYIPADQPFVLSLAPRLVIGIPPWRDPAKMLATVEQWLTNSLAHHGTVTMVLIAIAS